VLGLVFVVVYIRFCIESPWGRGGLPPRLPRRLLVEPLERLPLRGSQRERPGPPLDQPGLPPREGHPMIFPSLPSGKGSGQWSVASGQQPTAAFRRSPWSAGARPQVLWGQGMGAWARVGGGRERAAARRPRVRRRSCSEVPAKKWLTEKPAAPRRRGCPARSVPHLPQARSSFRSLTPDPWPLITDHRSLAACPRRNRTWSGRRRR